MHALRVALLAASLGAGELAASEDAPASAGPAPAMPALCVGLPLLVTVVGGGRFEGAFVSFGEDHLRLSTRDGVIGIAFPLVVSVGVGEGEVPPEVFLAAVRSWSEAARGEALASPPPALVGGASLLLWAGAGPAILGEWKRFAAYSVLEGALLGAGGIMLAKGQYGPLLPLGALDALVRGWAGAEAVDEARRRRRRAAAFAGGMLFPSGDPGATPVAGFVLTVPLGAAVGPRATVEGTERLGL